MAYGKAIAPQLGGLLSETSLLGHPLMPGKCAQVELRVGLRAEKKGRRPRPRGVWAGRATALSHAEFATSELSRALPWGSRARPPALRSRRRCRRARFRVRDGGRHQGNRGTIDGFVRSDVVGQGPVRTTWYRKKLVEFGPATRGPWCREDTFKTDALLQLSAPLLALPFILLALKLACDRHLAAPSCTAITTDPTSTKAAAVPSTASGRGICTTASRSARVGAIRGEPR